jgi:hypothetical protein
VNVSCVGVAVILVATQIGYRYLSGFADRSRYADKTFTESAPGVIPDWYHLAMAFTVRTDDEMERALTALAQAEGIACQEVICRSVLERFARTGRTERVHESTNRLVERWGDVLDRLGRV